MRIVAKLGQGLLVILLVIIVDNFIPNSLQIARAMRGPASFFARLLGIQISGYVIYGPGKQGPMPGAVNIDVSDIVPSGNPDEMWQNPEVWKRVEGQLRTGQATEDESSKTAPVNKP